MEKYNLKRKYFFLPENYTLHTAKRAEKSSEKTLKLIQILQNPLWNLVTVCRIVLPHSYLHTTNCYILVPGSSHQEEAGLTSSKWRYSWRLISWKGYDHTKALHGTAQCYLLDKSFSVAAFNRFNVIDIISHTTSLTLELTSIVFSKSDFPQPYF